MADCSYARCLQERRNIKRELQRWTKNMVHVVGLERVAEELMGRRKWKLYQDVLLARNLPSSQPDDSDALSDTATPHPHHHHHQQQQHQDDTHMIATAEAIQQRHTTAGADLDHHHHQQQHLASDEELHHHHLQQQQQQQQQQPRSPITVDEDSKEDEEAPTREDAGDEAASQPVLKIKTIEEINTVGVDGGGAANSTPSTAAAANNCKDGGETILESLIKRSSSGPPNRRPLPVDWTPQDKCHFCEDGELVRPAAPERPASEHPPSPVESESESSSSRSGTSPPRNQYLFNQAQVLATYLQLQQQQASKQPLTMSQMESMTASLAAVAALGPPLPPGLAFPPTAFLNPWYFGVHPKSSTTPDRTNVSSDKTAVTPSLSSPLQTEQPLDLSSKAPGPQDQDAKTVGSTSSSSSLEAKFLGMASPSSLDARLVGLRADPKQIFNRSKPRLAAPGGRRAYSEEDLQTALREIQSGRLGTRRAAVMFNIPRSTLRNKVYKMAVEKERESKLPGTYTSGLDRDDSNDIGEDVDEDKDSIMDEDKDEEKEVPRMYMDDFIRLSQGDSTSESLRALLQKSGQKFFDLESPKREPTAETWPGMDANIMAFQSLLMASGLNLPMAKADDNAAPMMPEIVRLLAEERQILKERLTKQDHLNNGKPMDQGDDDLAMNKRAFSRQSSSASSVMTKNDRATPGRKTDSPEEVPMDMSEQDAGAESRSSPSNVILRIPSFKLANTPNSNKNGGDAFSGPATPPLPFFSRSPHPEQAINVTPRVSDHLSPPLLHSKNMLSLKDVIAKSISQKFQQQAPPTNHNDLNQLRLGPQGMDAMESLNSFKRGGITPPVGGQGISVIKNLTSHDLTRNFTNNNSSSNNQSQQNNSTGGKGTRPKRGKYRNYDRDSLVEAVKAVQRGEMSVHRAGSYYGVPHSTLEYKVKERHLMRPRKREPKNPNPDDKSPMAGVSSKPGEIPGSGSLRLDKSKLPPQKPPTKPAFPASSPNGLKMPAMFDPALALGGYGNPPFPFWPPAPPFHGLPMEFSPRNPGASGGFPPGAEYYASQLVQRMQEGAARQKAMAGSGSVQHPNVPNPLLKSARDIAELYDGASDTNGSFLEGIIRSSLEQNPQRARASGGGDEGCIDSGGRRLRPDDMHIAEEMREAVRKVRSRETVGVTPAIPTVTTPAPEPSASSPPQTS